MPIYEYKCDNGHTFEAMQSMSEDAIDECDVVVATPGGGDDGEAQLLASL